MSIDYRYNPLSEVGSLLPNIRSVADKTFFVKKGKYKELWMAVDGKWAKFNLTPNDDAVFKSLSVDTFYADKFVYRQINAFNGDQMFSDTGEVEEVNGNIVRIKDNSGFNVCSFQPDDLVITKQVNPSDISQIRYVKATIDNVVGNELKVIYTSTDVFQKGDTIIRVGNTSDTSRQDSIFISTNETNTPYLDIYDNVDSFTDWDDHIPKVRVGKLTGITDADFGGTLSGSGAYVQNLYAKGKIYLSNNGSISLGKTAYDDATNDGFWIGDSDATVTVNPYFYLGNAGDTKYIKVDTTAGTFNTLGFTITGGILQTAVANQRVVISGTSNDIKFYESDGNLVGTITGIAAMPASILDINAPYVIDLEAGIYTRINGALVLIDSGSVNASITLNSKFQVDNIGNITKINNVAYSFPSVAPTLNQVLTCTNATGGVLSWSTPSASGITSLNGLTATTQTFSITDDTNVLLDIVSTTSTHAFTMGWSGQLAIARGGTGLSSLGTANQLLRVNAGATALEYFTPSYITLASLSGVSPISYNNGTGAISFLTNTDITWTGNHYYDGTSTKTYFGSGHYLQLPGYAGTTGGMIKYDSFVQKVYIVNNAGSDVELAYQTNATIPPASNTADNIPLWNGANSKTLKDGLAYTSLATAGTIVGRDGSGDSKFRSLYASSTIFLGTASTTSGVAQFYDSNSTYYVQLLPDLLTSIRSILFPNASGTLALTSIAGGGTNATSFTTNEMVYFDGTKLASAGFTRTEPATDLSTSGNNIILQNYAGTTLSTITAPYATTAGTVTNGVYTNANNALSGNNTTTGSVMLDGEVLLTLSGDISQSVSGKNTIIATNNDVSATITLTSPTDGQMLWVSNHKDSTQDVLLTPVRGGTGTTVTLTRGTSTWLRYLSSEGYWYSTK